MGQIIERIASYRVIHYILALCLLSSLFPFVVYGKYIAFAAMLLIALVNTYKGINIVLVVFWAWTMICSLLNGVWGLRDIAWTLVLLSATPMIGRSMISGDVLKALVRLLPLFVFVNLIAYVLNINYFFILYQEPNKFCFSGLTSHPQWLGAFTGLACVYTYYNAIIKKKEDRFRGVLAIVIFLTSVELGLLAGSRSALLSAVITIILMTILTFDVIKDFEKKIVLVLIILLLFMPIFLQSMEMIEVKQWTQSLIGHSRIQLWREQLFLIKNNWFLGIGLIGGESGNGWLSVISQTGLLGTVLFLLLSFNRCFIFVKKCLCKKTQALFVMCILLYITIHSCFEGYLLSPGFLLCWVFWCCLFFKF